MAPKQSKMVPASKSRPVKAIEKWGNDERQKSKSEWKHFSDNLARDGSEKAMPILFLHIFVELKSIWPGCLCIVFSVRLALLYIDFQPLIIF